MDLAGKGESKGELVRHFPFWTLGWPSRSCDSLHAPSCTVAVTAPPSIAFSLPASNSFLGHHLVDQIVESGHDVRVIGRYSAQTSEGGPIEYVQASVLDQEALEDAFWGTDRAVDGVFHLACLMEHSRCGQTNEMNEVNVRGTLTVLKACKAVNVKRIVYLSTAGVVSASKDGKIADEKCPYASEITKHWPFYQSKIQAEVEALKYATAQDLELVVLRPSLLFGPGDRRLSSTRIILDLVEGKVPFVPGGGVSFVDVRDVAQMCIVAMQKGRPNEIYHLVAANMKCREFFKTVEEVSGVKAPTMGISNMTAWLAASSIHGMKHLMGRWDPSRDPVVVEMSQHFWFADASKAKHELDFKPRDPKETVRDAVAWIEKYKGGLRVAESPHSLRDRTEFI